MSSVQSKPASKTENKTQAQQSGFLSIIYAQHWHVELVHFPVSFFLGSALFMVLHFASYANRDAFELASFVLLFSGMVVVVPTTITGWYNWKHRYHGARVKWFLYKIRTAFAMIVLSIALVVWRLAAPPPKDTAWFFAYAAGIFLLLIGTVIEGYFGGKLNHH